MIDFDMGVYRQRVFMRERVLAYLMAFLHHNKIPFIKCEVAGDAIEVLSGDKMKCMDSLMTVLESKYYLVPCGNRENMFMGVRLVMIDAAPSCARR
jgi:hypothetical protein